MNINNKIFSGIVAFMLLISCVKAQKLITIGDQGGDELLDIAVYYDNINLGGTFQQQLAGVLSLGGSDIFLQQYDLLGQLNWTYLMRGQGNDFLRSMSCSPSGTIYSAGTFGDNLTFGLNNDTVLTNLQQAVFISKHNQQGQLIWAKKISSKGFLTITDIETDASDNIYLTGSFKDTFEIDAAHQLIGTRRNNLFLIKLNAEGKVLWAKQASFSEESEGVALALDTTGNLFLTGIFRGFLSFGIDTMQAHVIYESIFLTQVDTNNGDWLWQKSFGGVYANNCTQIKYHQGNLYLGGYFSGILNMDSIRLITAHKNYTDGFIAKLNTDGTVVWASQSSTDLANCVVEDFSFYNNNLVLCGSYDNRFTWETTQDGAEDGLEAFQLAMNLDGKQLTLQTWKGQGFDLPRANAIHSSGQVLTVGGFQQDMLVDNITLNAQGFSDGFLLIQQAIILTNIPFLSNVEESKWSVFPNPVQDILTIEGSDEVLKKWQLIDNQGRLLLSGTASSLSVKSLAKGVYILLITTENKFITKKIIVN